MFILYARPGAGSVAVEALLAELGTPHRVEDLLRNADGSLPASVFKVNPRGEIPALRLPDDSIMTESAAIMIYLADLFPAAGLAPAAAAATRAEYLRWMLYFASAVYMADLRYFYPQNYAVDENQAGGIKAKATEHLDRDFAIFAESLSTKPFVLGETFSAVDIYAAMLVSWAPDIAALFKRHPNLKAHYNAVARRPKIATVWQRNDMPVPG
jgi:glutathione S-transferase